MVVPITTMLLFLVLFTGKQYYNKSLDTKENSFVVNQKNNNNSFYDLNYSLLKIIVNYQNLFLSSLPFYICLNIGNYNMLH